MKTWALGISAVGISALLLVTARAQSPSPAENADQPRLDAVTKKLDDVNTKIDALSQQILKIEQQLNSMSRPGVMIGEPTPPPTAPVAADSKVSPPPPNGNSHTIAKGETLTSIAKMHKVTVDELQKFNHIENDRKLQVGQTIMIPAPSASPSASISAPPTTP